MLPYSESTGHLATLCVIYGMITGGRVDVLSLVCLELAGPRGVASLFGVVRAGAELVLEVYPNGSRPDF